MRVVGIDPGTSGAFAFFSPPPPLPPGVTNLTDLTAQTIVLAWDMPINEITVGGKPRKRIDRLGLGELIAQITMLYDPQKWIVEKVGGMPGNSGMFEFGYTVGCIHQALTERGIPFETVTPTQWKKELKAPREKKECIAKADELWPHARSVFRTDTTKKGLRPDRAEAALLAYWGSGVWK